MYVYIYIYICKKTAIDHSAQAAAKDAYVPAIPVSEKQNSPFYANLDPAMQQQKLLSSPGFCSLTAYLPTSPLLRRRVFSQTPVVSMLMQRLL